MCDIGLNFKDLPKFGSKIQEDNPLFKVLFFFNFCTPLGPKLCPFKIQTFFMEKTGDPLIFAPSVIYRDIGRIISRSRYVVKPYHGRLSDAFKCKVSLPIMPEIINFAITLSLHVSYPYGIRRMLFHSLFANVNRKICIGVNSFSTYFFPKHDRGVR